MGRLIKGNEASLLMWSTIATLLSQNLVIPVLSTANFQDQKSFIHFPPNPYTGHTPPITTTPPIVTTPPIGPVTPTPSHGSGGGSHASTPSHGSAPPATNCPNPPSNGGHQSPSPAPPKSGSSGGKGHHHQHSPPTTPCAHCSSPSTPKTPTTPSTPKTPTTPSTPTTPGSVPTPPFDPKTPFTGTCNFWKSHPQYIVGIFGWWGTLGKAFGVTSLPGFGPHTSILDLLSNNHNDGFGSLCREGTASLLNSMVDKKFSYSTKQVRDHFVASLTSEKAAAHQANLFKLANEGTFKSRA